MEETILNKNNNKLLPDGYTQLEYIQYVPQLRPKLFIIKGFKTQSEVIKFAKNLGILNNVKIGINPTCGWIIEFEEDLLEKIKNSINHDLKLCRTSYPTINSIYSPNIYRYLPKEFLDNFFIDGSLRLGSFNKFKALENKNLKDKEEGIVELNVETLNGSKLESKVGFGNTSFVLCCSLKNDITMHNYYKTNSILIIKDILSFSTEITKVLKANFAYEVLECILGPCEYVSRRNISETNIEKDITTEFSINKDSFYGEKFLSSMYKYCENRPLFLKPNHFSKEAEYRVIWQIESYNIPDFIDIKVPEAIKFCSYE